MHLLGIFLSGYLIAFVAAEMCPDGSSCEGECCRGPGNDRYKCCRFPFACYQKSGVGYCLLGYLGKSDIKEVKDIAPGTSTRSGITSEQKVQEMNLVQEPQNARGKICAF